MRHRPVTGLYQRKIVALLSQKFVVVRRRFGETVVCCYFSSAISLRAYFSPINRPYYSEIENGHSEEWPFSVF